MKTFIIGFCAGVCAIFGLALAVEKIDEIEDAKWMAAYRT